MHSAALVGTNGAIDFLCWPHFGSPTVFAAALDPNIGGFFQISARDPQEIRGKQMYWPGTNILVTRFLSQHGMAQLKDFMPVKASLNPAPPSSPGSPPKGNAEIGADAFVWRNAVVRVVEGVRGRIHLILKCYPAFDYARIKHSTILHTDSNGLGFEVVFASTALTLKLIVRCQKEGTLEKVEQVGSGIEATFSVSESAGFATELRVVDDPVLYVNGTNYAQYHAMLYRTVRYWKDWLAQCTYCGAYQEKIHRSALVLKLMTYQSGAIVASLTFGFPEEIGGQRNWDYRYTWIRDSAFTLYALLRIGFKSEAADFMAFIEARCREAKFEAGVSPLQIMYGIHGEHELDETDLRHLAGHFNSRPVYIGNWAWKHLQLDIYGELLDAVYLYNKWGQPISFDFWTHLVKIIDWVCTHWTLNDLSIWEPPLDRVGVEGLPFVYSKLMCWVAIDRALRLADKRSFPVPSRIKWIETRDQIFLEIIDKGWNPNTEAFRLFYGGESLDAAHLLMPLVFFLAPNDPRIVKTLHRISQPVRDGGLMSGGLVYRYQRAQFDDGLPGEEGTFNMCTFWLIESLCRSGGEKVEQGRLLFEQMLTFANHLGLYSEETSKSGLMLGNFPQALTHLTLISAAFNLNRALNSHAPNSA